MAGNSDPLKELDYVALPKIELHAHLTGSIKVTALHQVWLRKKEAGETDLEDPLTVMPEEKRDYNLQTFFPLFSKYIYNLVTDPVSIKQTALSVLQHFHDDGVVYLELRTTPRGSPLVSMEEYVRLILSSITEFEEAHPRMHTRLILSVDRRHELPTALSILDLAKKYHGRGVVGLDLCGDPAVRGDGDIKVLDPVFRDAKAAGLGITLHFCEAQTSASAEEIRTLLSWQPDRLGHVIWEDEETKREIALRGLCLELCLSCNIHAGMIKGREFRDHHLGHWMGVEGVKVSLGTDDVGVFGSPLSNEYRLAAEHFHLDTARISWLAKQGVDSIFGGEEEKDRVRGLMGKWTEANR